MCVCIQCNPVIKYPMLLSREPMLHVITQNLCRNCDDIMADEEAEDQQVRKGARDALDRVSGDDRVSVIKIYPHCYYGYAIETLP